MNPEQFVTQLAQHGIKLTTQQLKQFDTYFHKLIEANQHVNLTTIVERDDVYLKHFYDSITPAFYVDELRTQSLSLCDVGAGAGFPSLPLKIIFPQLKVTIVDSLKKRLVFLATLLESLGISDVKLVHMRAEEYGSKKSSARQSFDVVTARAVARMSVLSELCLPLVKISGQLIALKAAKADQELKDSQKAIQILGGQIGADYQFDLPISHDERNIVVIKKIKSTPKQYPRKAGTPNRNPIGS